ncbi:MAG: thiol-disulfide oxidoreductase DCC family protein [Bacteroidota bacterium]
MGSPGALARATVQDVILFDGVCNLCNGAVQFILRRDRKKNFKFASLQSSFGQQQLKKFGLDTNKLHSIIVLDAEGRFYEKSDAALFIAKHLSGLWPTLSFFKIVPRFIRNAIYDLIARNRYRLFGKKDQCMIPTPELKSRFID